MIASQYSLGIQQALTTILVDFEKKHRLHQSDTSAILTEYCLRPSKRIRALILLLSYLGYRQDSPTKKLFHWAASLELLQAFVLIHDDLVDHAILRRGGLPLHKALSKAKHSADKGQHIALIQGDLLFALGIQQFLKIDAVPQLKEKALQLLLNTAVITSLGEINDCLEGTLAKIRKQDIYAHYDQKTGYYSFVTPLVAGAILAKQNTQEIQTLKKIGLCLGRAFQLQDDLLDITGSLKKTGKTILNDLKESKLTLLIYYAYHTANQKRQKTILRIFNKKNKTRIEIQYLRQCCLSENVLALVEKEIEIQVNTAIRLIKKLRLRNQEKEALLKIAYGLNKA